MDERFYEAQEQAAVDREHDPQGIGDELDLRPLMEAIVDEAAEKDATGWYRIGDEKGLPDEYDPNTDAFDREMESRIAGEREHLWNLRPLMKAIAGSEPPSVARSASDSPIPQAVHKVYCELCAVDTSLKSHVVAFTRAVDSLEAVVQRLRRFLMVGP